MKSVFLTIALLLTFAGVSNAQTPAVSTSFLEWDQDAPTLQDAIGYTYRYYPDGGSGQPLANVACQTTQSPTVFLCRAPFPAFTPGNHTVEITASNLAGESTRSNLLAFIFVVTPAAPSGLRIG